MAFTQNLRNPLANKWVSSIFVKDKLRLPRTSLEALRFYRTKSSQKSNNVPQITQAVKREAQAALLEYLHSTRSLLFTDAESMSKNSPSFLGRLLTRVDINNQAEIRRSVTKFLRYHPINEFEPFFESMGLNPSDYSLLLPRLLMFLSDDPVLMDNYHVLCNYGIAGKKIGKFYKEAPEIFRDSETVLWNKLVSFEKMGLSQSIVIKAVVSCPRLLVGNMTRDFFEILQRLNSVGPGYGWIEKHLSDGNSYDWSSILELLRFLNEIGCSNEQLGGLVRNQPRILFEKSGAKTFLVIGFLMKFGYSSDEICSVFLQFPEILVGKFLENLQHSYKLLTDIEMDVLDIGEIICSYSILLGSGATKRANSLLTTMSISKERLCEIVKNNPEVIKNKVVTLKQERSRTNEPEERSQMNKKEFLLDLGFDENSAEIKRAIKCFRGKGVKLQERFNTFVNAGLDPKEVVDMVKVAPQILNLSKHAIERKIEFLVIDMGYPVSALMPFPAFITYKLQRVQHRLEMYKWLQDQGVAEPNLALSTLLASGDKSFIKSYVNRHPEGLVAWERLRQTVNSDER